MANLTDIINEATRRVERANREEAKAFQAKLAQAERQRAEALTAHTDAEAALMTCEPQNELEAFAQAQVRRREQQEAHDAEKRKEEEARQAAYGKEIDRITAERKATQAEIDAERRRDELESKLLMSKRSMQGIIAKSWDKLND